MEDDDDLDTSDTSVMGMTTSIDNAVSISYVSSLASGDLTSDIVADTADISGKLTVNGADVGEFMSTMKERFLVLESDFKKHKQYPALKDAYEKYKLIEKLLQENK